MNGTRGLFERAFNYLQTIGLADVLDILIVAYLIYLFIELIKRTNARNLAIGLVIFLTILWVSEAAGLNMISYGIRKAVELGLIALVILFQPELRRMLEKLGSGLFNVRGSASENYMERTISQTILACTQMSSEKTGALIVFEKNLSLSDIINTGTKIDAEVSAELLRNIFFNKAPLHDGAVIIRDGRIAAAGCVLPLTKTVLSKDLGMRHRAGIGMSEQSDAVVLIVSEETGNISCSIEGTLKRHMNAQSIDALLKKELFYEEEKKSFDLRSFLQKFFPEKKKEENTENAENEETV